MKPPPRNFLIPLAVLAPLVAGCGGGHDRQMIYTQPRVAPIGVDTREGVRVRAPFVDVYVPKGKSLSRSNGIDVPMVEPN